MFLPYKKGLLSSDIDYKLLIKLQSNNLIYDQNIEERKTTSNNMIKVKSYSRRVRRGIKND